MNAIRALRTNTREGFRLLVAWFAGVLSFGILSSLAETLILYVQPLQPGRAENVTHSEAELVLLFFLIGLGVLALAGALILEGLEPRADKSA